MVRFQPYSLAIQTRFKWRHKETDRWRRLMDATCFNVDWITQTQGANMSQSGGNWSHFVTCAHVVCPWNYPNYYPPTGHTRFVSRITLADTQNQIRVPSLQGNVVYRHFASNYSVFVHSNPRLDLCVLHPEQLFKRFGESKMLWLQNEGLVMRPRFELNEELRVGDHVWIYGMIAKENLFDEEKAAEPLMIPTGIRARVHAKTREHFFLDTTSVEGSEKGQVPMGMCGSVIMRNGRCVGMLTATVHEQSSCAELAGTAMCTYASDIFEFLIEVEKQMKNPLPDVNPDPSIFQKRRQEEGQVTQEPKDWGLDQTRTARHVKVPLSLHHMEESSLRQDDVETEKVLFGRSGIFNQDTQESALGYDINTSSSEKPTGLRVGKANYKDGKQHAAGERRDDSPGNIYLSEDDIDSRSATSEADAAIKDMFHESVNEPVDIGILQGLRHSFENAQVVRERQKMRENVFKHAGRKDASSDPLGASSAGRYDGDVNDGIRNFTEEAVNFNNNRSTSTDAWTPEGGFEHPSDIESRAPPVNPEVESTSAKKEEKERKYQEALRKRHASRPTEESFEFWGRH